MTGTPPTTWGRCSRRTTASDESSTTLAKPTGPSGARGRERAQPIPSNRRRRSGCCATTSGSSAGSTCDPYSSRSRSSPSRPAGSAAASSGREPAEGGNLLVAPASFPLGDELPEHLLDVGILQDIAGCRGPRGGSVGSNSRRSSETTVARRSRRAAASTRSTRGSLKVSTLTRFPSSSIVARKIDSPLASSWLSVHCPSPYAGRTSGRGPPERPRDRASRRPPCTRACPRPRASSSAAAAPWPPATRVARSPSPSSSMSRMCFSSPVATRKMPPMNWFVSPSGTARPQRTWPTRAW